MDEKIDAAINAHAQWFQRLRKAIESRTSEFNPLSVKVDNACEFGKWLYNDFPSDLKKLPIYAEIKALHAKFHIVASNILEIALKGNKEEAIKLMAQGSEFMNISGSLVLKLKSLKKQ